MANIFRIDKTRNMIVLDVDYCEFYIPQSFFESTKGYATNYVNYINVFGIFLVGLFDNGTLSDIKTLNMPAFMDVKVYDSENMVISSDNGPIPVLALKYVKNQDICSSLIRQDALTAETFLNLLISGSLPETLKYPDIINIWHKNTKLAGVNFGVASAMLETIISVVYRDKHDGSKKFSKVYGKGGVSPYDYTESNIREICQQNSTFTSIIFEDIDSMITSSINRNRFGKPETESPIEKTLKM